MTEKKSNTSITFDQILLYIIAIYHMALGIMGIFFKSQAVLIARSFFSFNLDYTSQIKWIINPFAAYVFIFGIFVWVAATNPSKYRLVIWAILGLFVIRVLQRGFFILFADPSLKAIVDPTQNLIHLLIVAAISVWLLKIALQKK